MAQLPWKLAPVVERVGRIVEDRNTSLSYARIKKFGVLPSTSPRPAAS